MVDRKTIDKISTLGNIPNNNYHSHVKYNREELLSQETAHELNTYLSFEPFATFNDLYTSKYLENEDWKEDEGVKLGTPGVRSIFNKSGAVVIGSSTGDLSVDVTNGDSNNTSEWRISNNVPLMDSPEARRRIRANSGCSVKELVNASQAGVLGRETYSYSDFMYCKYLGKVSNNYLITLRRFPLPVDDYTSSVGETSRVDLDIRSKNSESIGCMVTWLGTPGNDMNNILAYTVSMPYKEASAEMMNEGVNADSGTGIFNGIAAAMDPAYRKQYMEGYASAAANKVMGKFFNVSNSDAPYSVETMNQWRDKNKVYGPVDTIKKAFMRSDEGINFTQNITLTFDYELRSYNGINGRQAMLDLLTNILNVTYTTGTFWGGGYRGGGAHQNNIFANMNIFKAHGGFTDFIDAGVQDLSNLHDMAKEKYGPFTFKNVINTFKQIGNQIGGMFIAAKLNAFGRPQKQLVNSLLSPAPVGFWHLTVGNPHHPIMSMGNMILKSAKIEHYGPLGIDDFPTGLKVTCELERGKPRDIRDIEKIYMHGNDRIYSSMGPKVFDMYRNSKVYKSSIGNKNTELSSNNTDSTARKKMNNVIASASEVKNIDKIKEVLKEANVDISQLKDMGSTLQKYFGQRDAYSIYVAAAEQENGSQRKKSRTASGDSSQKGTGGWMK